MLSRLGFGGMVGRLGFVQTASWQSRLAKAASRDWWPYDRYLVSMALLMS
jgi:hypothetical protein